MLKLNGNRKNIQKAANQSVDGRKALDHTTKKERILVEDFQLDRHIVNTLELEFHSRNRNYFKLVNVVSNTKHYN